jgi:hypothetical protein
MPFTVADFYAKLKYGGARQNLFEVILPFPTVTGGLGQSSLFTFMCKSSNPGLPGEDVTPIAVPYFGRQIKVPGDRTFPEWTVTVINDQGFELRDTFEKWSNAINGHYNNLRNPAALRSSTEGGGSGYSANATIIQYGKIGDVLKEYDMIGVWPSNISGIDLAWDANDQIEEFSVTFQYQWWESRSSS